MPDSHIGPYRITSLLGAGGMGEVYRAHDANLARDVALKVLPRALADDPERRMRILREARAVAALNHPNICTIYDAGDADGRLYIAMELIDGESIAARRLAGPMTPEEVLRVALQLTDAVAHAHDRGIVHRDLTGANVMITRDGRVKVLDFGLARRFADQDDDGGVTRTASAVTAPHTVLGTVPFMSPEQLRGQPADARSDNWALGVILYEMIAGVRPFDGRTSFELSSAILHEPARPLPPGVPVALQAVIGRCLEKEPARRYQRAGEVHAALEAVRLDGTAPVAARPAVPGRRWWLLAAVVMAIAAAVVWTVARRVTTAPAAQRIHSIAVLPLENLSGDSGQDYFVAGIHEALITDLARIGLDKVIAKASADAVARTRAPLREVARELGVEGLVTGSVMREGDRVQITAQLVDAGSGAVVWANKYERQASGILSLQNDVVGAIAREVRATLTPEQSARLAAARQLNAAAHDAYLRGRSLYAAAVASAFDLKGIEAARAQYEQSIRIDPDYAPPYAAIAVTHLLASQTSLLPPDATFPNARAAAVKAVQLDDTLAEAHAALAEVNTWYDWDWTSAARETRRALELNPDLPDALRAEEVLATLVTGRPDDAARTSQRILAVDPLNPFSRVQPTWVAFFSRRHDESLAFANTLVDVWPQHPMGPFFLASNYAVKHMADDVHRECDKILKMIGGAYVMQIIGQCAWAYGIAGQDAQARALLRVLENPPPGVWLDPVVMGQVYGAVGDLDRAMDWFERGLRERSPNMIYGKAAVSWDSVRRHARFPALLRQMHFPD